MSESTQCVVDFQGNRNTRVLVAAASRLLIGLALIALAAPSFAQGVPLFEEKTDIVEAIYYNTSFDEFPFLGADISSALGDPVYNFAATRASATADVDQDGFPDIVEYSIDSDAAPFEELSGSHSIFIGTIVRLNDQKGSFDVVELGEPIDFGTVRSIALADLDGDGYPDLIQAVDRFSGSAVEIYFNQQGVNGEYFALDQAPDFVASMSDCPARLEVGLLNADAAPDFVVARLSECGLPNGSVTSVFYNNNGGTPLFVSQDLQAPAGQNFTVDVALLDADNDNLLDVVTVNAAANSSEIFLNNGTTIDLTPSATIAHAYQALTAEAGDLDGDGSTDLVLTGVDRFRETVPRLATAHLNDGIEESVGFSSVGVFDLYGSAKDFRDIKLGDVDGDGDVDILLAWSQEAVGLDPMSQSGGVTTALSDGGVVPAFTNDVSTSEKIVPQTLALQRLSLELFDWDLDGDLDVFVAGGLDQKLLYADGESQCEGCVPNQLFENRTIVVDTDLDGVTDFADNCPVFWNPGQEDADQDGVGDVCAENQCTDGVDNDLDGKIDGGDLDCTNGVDSELPACIDGGDNDNDGLTDYLEDPDCQGDPFHIAEHYIYPSCGLGFELVVVLVPLMAVRRRRNAARLDRRS